MTTKRKTTKTAKRRTTSESSKKTKRKQKPGALAHLPQSPALVRHVERLREQIAENAMLCDKYSQLTEGPRFSFETVDEAHKIPQVAWDAFLSDLRETGNITKSCVRVGIKRITVYKHAEYDEVFEKELRKAHQVGLARLEDVAVQRATEGVDRPVFFQGEVVGYTREYSDQLLQFLLKGNMKKYRDTNHDEETDDPANGVLAVPAPLDSEDWEGRAIEMQRALREDVRK